MSISQPIIKNRWAVGILSVLPMGSFQEQVPYFVDERAQFFDNRLHFENYDNKFGSLLLVAATSVRLTQVIKIGAGLTLSNQSNAKPAVFVSDAAKTETSLTLSNVKVNSVFAPHIGIHFQLAETWQLVSNLHFPYRSSVKGDSRLRFWDQGREDEMKPPVEFEFVYDYMPLRLSIGQQYAHQIGQYEVSVSGGVTLYQWSTYIDRVGEQPSNFSDTVVPEAKLEISRLQHSAYVSGRYTPSNIPEQAGRSNYVDNDQIASDFGYQYTEHMGSNRYHFGLGVQFYRLLERTHHKRSTAQDPIIDELPDAVSIQDRQPIETSAGTQTNNPGFPSFSSKGSGVIIGAMLGIDYE